MSAEGSVDSVEAVGFCDWIHRGAAINKVPSWLGIQLDVGTAGRSGIRPKVMHRPTEGGEI
ncbi:MAG: hypothetical protein KGL18_07470 [Burkholderiales bacterium]|nr:hypothetical protein [Burkholderiales bacterium]MDE1926075.1 hypothetical protein [Burkholderiales bacterium]MDE2158173.1 hypothetical protein [Burkholderiales bacterium]MDE2502798.1 hypothetical protein [Burkholderiales bacterium]